MNRLFRLLGFRDREYRGTDFSVRIEPLAREVISIVYERQGNSFNFDAQRIGRKWEGIEVHIPQEIEPEQLPQIVRDLETSFLGLRRGYVIARKAGIETVAETEQQAAMAELRNMGYDIEILPDRSIRQSRRPGTPHQEIESLRKTAARTMSLLQALHGTRQRFEILARSSEFSPPE